MSIAATVIDTLLPDTRMARRRERKRDIAALDLTRQKVDELDAQLADIDQRKDAAAATHCDKCRPLQAELSAIEERIVSRVADREALDPADDSRRKELLAAVAAENSALELSIAALDSERNKVVQSREQLRGTLADYTVLKNSLHRAPLVNPDLALKHFAALNGVKWAVARREAAAAEANKYRSLLASKHHTADADEVHKARLAKWQAELTAAIAAEAAAQREEADLRQQIENE